ncbi:MAG: hypothetical protein IJS26_02225 [Alphaproteobacteria bacterium]|nr:hypothetical protein [Alphaproteobacteria bacterium]
MYDFFVPNEVVLTNNQWHLDGYSIVEANNNQYLVFTPEGFQIYRLWPFDAFLFSQRVRDAVLSYKPCVYQHELGWFVEGRRFCYFARSSGSYSVLYTLPTYYNYWFDFRYLRYVDLREYYWFNPRFVPMPLTPPRHYDYPPYYHRPMPWPRYEPYRPPRQKPEYVPQPRRSKPIYQPKQTPPEQKPPANPNNQPPRRIKRSGSGASEVQNAPPQSRPIRRGNENSSNKAENQTSRPRRR